MPDMRLTKYPIPTQSPEERVTNYSEVALGYDADTCKFRKNGTSISDQRYA